MSYSIRKLAEIFGGIIAAYVQSCDEENSDPEILPDSDMLQDLIYHLRNHLILPDHLVKYSCSTILEAPDTELSRMTTACKHGSLEFIKYILEGRSIKITIRNMADLCIRGHITAIKWIISHTIITLGDLELSDLFCIAGKWNRIEVVHYLYDMLLESDFKFDWLYVNYITECWYRNGAVDTVKWLYQEFKPLYRSENIQKLVDCECEVDEPRILKWLIEEHKANFTIDHFIQRCVRGHLQTAKLLYKSSYKQFNRYHIEPMLKAASIEMLQWFMDTFPDHDKLQIFNVICMVGRTDLAIYMKEKYDISFSTEFLHSACKTGNVKIFEWIVNTWRPSDQIISTVFKDSLLYCWSKVEILYDRYSHISIDVSKFDYIQVIKTGFFSRALWMEKTFPSVNIDKDYKSLYYLLSECSISDAQWYFCNHTIDNDTRQKIYDLIKYNCIENHLSVIAMLNNIK